MIDKDRSVISKKDYIDISRYILKAPAPWTSADIKQAIMEKWPHLNLEARSLRRRIKNLRQIMGADQLTNEQVEELLTKCSRGYDIACGMSEGARKKLSRRKRRKKAASARRKKESKPEIERKKEYADLRTKTAKMLSVKVGDIGKKWASC